MKRLCQLIAHLIPSALIGISGLLLTSCGGESSTLSTSAFTPASTGGPNLPPVTAKTTGIGFNLYYPDELAVGQSVSIVVAATGNGSLSQVNWQQTAGPKLDLLASHTQIIGFDLRSSGDYSFALLALTSSGQNIQQSVSFTVLEDNVDYANIRLDHVAVEQGRVSLRVDSSASSRGKAISSVVWQQIAGSDALNLEKDEQYLFFDAPNVAHDTLLEFQAQINYEDGSSSSDNSYILIKNTEINSEGYFPKFSGQVVSTDVFAYRVNGPYAERLVDCVYNNHISNSCSFNSLPLLGHEHASPEVEQVLERLVVSHPWMGDRFKQFLQQSAVADDMLQLLRATTAIVISYDVRPSFYWTATGAIYLDAANFWLSPGERDTLNDQSDYRLGFGDELAFTIPWRYVKNNDYYIRRSDYPASERMTRAFSALEASASWLMYHELGHANDFFPPGSWAYIDKNTSPLSYANDVPASSSDFSTRFPLSSDEMRELANVSFAGQNASDEQKTSNAQQVTLYFEPDSAPAYYSYSTIREDYATLFERFMMAYRLGASSDVAVISTDNNDELLVTWGQRDRISLPRIQGRVKQVVERILPELDVAAIQATLPTPLLMTPGLDWFSNIDLSPSAAPGSEAKKGKNKPSDPSDYWQRYHHGPDRPNIK
ncbi:MAG: hypothetical protein ACI8Z9_000402 [Paraglaciecola sp.]